MLSPEKRESFKGKWKFKFSLKNEEDPFSYRQTSCKDIKETWISRGSARGFSFSFDKHSLKKKDRCSNSSRENNKEASPKINHRRGCRDSNRRIFKTSALKSFFSSITYMFSKNSFFQTFEYNFSQAHRPVPRKSGKRHRP